jgi:hypothetical protein
MSELIGRYKNAALADLREQVALVAD